MDSAPVAESEPQRLAALHSTGLLESPAEPAFDELVALTARLLGAPIAAFNLIDADRQWTKAGTGSESAAELLARADAALYAAKVAGRDRTRLASGPETVPAPTQS
jgi:hypothetical protein